MKKLAITAALLLSSALAFASCSAADGTSSPSTALGNDSANTKVATVINVGAVTEPHGIGLAKAIDEASVVTDSEYVFDFLLDTATENVLTDISVGEIDIAVVPAELASVLYNNLEKDVVVLSVNTLSDYYIVENGETINTAEDIKGKTVYTTGEGSSEEYVLRYLLDAYGLVPGADVNISFKNERSECLAAITEDKTALAVLDAAFMASEAVQNTGIRIAIDVNKECKKLTGNNIVSSVAIARKSFVQEHPDAIQEFLEALDASEEFIGNSSSVASLMEKHGIAVSFDVEKALSYCRFTYMDGEDMKSEVSAYLSIINRYNPGAVGGELPGEDFYYIGE